ncbi:hypothetical protein [Limisphaera sp. VF-2]|uniref:hypothetical protein n=1 Tax=Limisphaera sp. VF-2 TaxID=3400418 RepID=UPI002562630D|nr:hypothetical protein [Limisphaera sp.]
MVLAKVSRVFNSPAAMLAAVLLGGGTAIACWIPTTRACSKNLWINGVSCKLFHEDADYRWVT